MLLSRSLPYTGALITLAGPAWGTLRSSVPQSAAIVPSLPACAFTDAVLLFSSTMAQPYSGWACLGRAGVRWGVLKAASSMRGSLADSGLGVSGALSWLTRLQQTIVLLRVRLCAQAAHKCT